MRCGEWSEPDRRQNGVRHLDIPNPREHRAPEAACIYAVGDIHGRRDLLEGLVGELRNAATASPPNQRLITVFLGDYIDRGPDSRGVLSRLIELRQAETCDLVFLRGNHEQVLLDLLDGHETTSRWLEYGGRETLASYGVSALPPPSDVETLRSLIAASIPPAHVAFLRDTQLHVQLGDYLFVHAGLRPDRLLEEQSEADLLWFRYYDDEAPVWPYTVVHGHSPNPRPVLGRNRIAIDTEAYATGALTALRLQGDRREFLRITRAGVGAPAAVGRWDDVDSSYRRAGPKPESDAVARPERPTAPPQPPRSKTAKRVVTPKARAYRRPAAALLGLAALGLASAGAFAIGISGGESAPEPAEAGAPPVLPTLARPLPAPAPAGAAAMNLVAEAQTNATAAPGPGDRARVQVAAAPTPEAAERIWQDLVRKFPEPTRSKSLQVDPVQAGGATLHRAMVAGFDDAAAAAEFCRTLKSEGRDCLVRTAAAPPSS